MDEGGSLFKPIATHVPRSHVRLHCVDEHFVLQLPYKIVKFVLTGPRGMVNTYVNSQVIAVYAMSRCHCPSKELGTQVAAEKEHPDRRRWHLAIINGSLLRSSQ